MKKKPISVTPAMKERIRAEMKRNHQTDQDMADILYITRQQYSRIINGKYNLVPEHLKKLLSVWGVRESYLLGNDNFRTIDDLLSASNKKLTAKADCIFSLLELCEYEIEFVEMIRISVSEAAALSDAEKLLAMITPYVREPLEPWESFRRSVLDMATNKADYVKQHAFLLSGHFMVFGMNGDITVLQELAEYVNYYAKVSKNGELIGYIPSPYTEDYLEVIAGNIEMLFSSMLKINNTELVIRSVDNIP